MRSRVGLNKFDRQSTQAENWNNHCNSRSRVGLNSPGCQSRQAENWNNRSSKACWVDRNTWVHSVYRSDLVAQSTRH